MPSISRSWMRRWRATRTRRWRTRSTISSRRLGSFWRASSRASARGIDWSRDCAPRSMPAPVSRAGNSPCRQRHDPVHASAGVAAGNRGTMPLAITEIVDISLDLDDSKFAMRTPPGFKRDMQFQLEVLKEHDAAEGAGQIVRGVHMRLHAGSHIDAPEHNVKGGKQVQDLPLATFAGDAVIADLRHLVPGKAITADELEKAVGAVIRRGDR